MKKILITCGETSSELIASRLVGSILELKPEAEILALGSKNLEDAGAKILFRMEDYSVMGFWEVLKKLPLFISLEKSLKSMISAGDIGLFIPVDFPGLNLRLSGFAKRLSIPVLYFISPQVWAWGSWRLNKIRKAVDLMAVLFQFEEELYRNEEINVLLIKHPLLDIVNGAESPKELPTGERKVKIVIFPGSRNQEVLGMLPVLIRAAMLIGERFKNAVFVIGLAPLIDEACLDIPADFQGRVRVTREGLNELGDATLVLASSGTVTLQSAISGTPTIVIYKTSPLTYLLGRLLVRVPSIAMPNLIAGEEILPELIQGEATPHRIASEAISLLSDAREYRELSKRLLDLRKELKKGRNISDLARIALNMIS